MTASRRGDVALVVEEALIGADHAAVFQDMEVQREAARYIRTRQVTIQREIGEDAAVNSEIARGETGALGDFGGGLNGVAGEYAARRAGAGHGQEMITRGIQRIGGAARR